MWNNYFSRVSRILKSLSKTQKDEIILELESHLFASITDDKTNDEPTKVLNAIEQLGEPETYLKPIVADKLLSDTAKSFNPKKILKALYYNLFYTTFKRAVISFFLSAGYFVLLSLFVIAVLKFFVPESVGMFIYENGDWSFGIDVQDGGWTFGVNAEDNGDRTTRRELLGYWIVPIGISVSILLQYVLRKLSALLVTKQE